jgi:CO dehydrogenase maturation factor
MKIAISGKGGVGKTTIAGCLAKALAEEGYKVLAIDADPDSNLASALGVPKEKLDKVVPIAEMTKLVEERTGAKKGTFGGFFKLNPKVDDIPDKFCINHNDVKLLILGSVPQGGGGCFCPENVLLKSLIRHLFLNKNEAIVLDMEAGLEHLGRGSTAGMDAFIVVVEPGIRSVQTAQHIKKLALDLGIKDIYVIGNKILSEDDKKFIEENLKEFDILGFFSFNQNILKADREDKAPFEVDPSLIDEAKKIIRGIK